MIRNILILLSGIAMAYCSNNQTSTIPQTAEEFIEQDPVVDSIVKGLMGSSYVMMQPPPASSPLKQYERFEALVRLADEEQLQALCTHKNAVVRAHAYWALARRHYPEMLRILDDHLNDTAYVSLQYKCYKRPIQIYDFYLQMVTPGLLDSTTIKLSEDQLRPYMQTAYHRSLERGPVNITREDTCLETTY